MNTSLEKNISLDQKTDAVLNQSGRVLWTTLFLSEAILVLFSNCLSLVIFLKKRFLVKKSTYLIICLTMADFLVGVAVFTTGLSVYYDQVQSFKTVGSILFKIKTSLTAGTVMLSLLLLALISLERLYAVVFPLRHRLSKTCHYLIGMASCWIAATLLSLFVTFLNKPHGIFGNIALAIGVAMLVIIFASYFIIWIKIKCYRQNSENKRSEEESRRLAKTLFIITVLTLLIYVPKVIITFIKMCQTCHDTSSMEHSTDLVMYSNSFLNLIVYSCRMPEFRNELKAIFCANILCSLKKLKCLGRRRKDRSKTDVSMKIKQQPQTQVQGELSLDNRVSIKEN